MNKLFSFALTIIFFSVISSCNSSDTNKTIGNKDTTVKIHTPELQQKQPISGEKEENEGQKELVKPMHFPESGIDDLGDIFGKKNILNEKKFMEILTTWQAIQNLGNKIPANLKLIDDTAEAILNKTVNDHGFKSWKTYQNYLTVMVTAMMVLPTLIELENAKGKNAVAYDITKQIISSIVTKGNISKKDIRFVYNHWNESKAIVDEINKSHPKQKATD